MAKKLNEEYLKKLFELVGPGASKIKDWTAAAELVDENMEISRSSGARYQIVVSILKSTAFTGPESPIEIVFKGTKFDTITIKDADKAVKKFFDSGKKKSLPPVKPKEGKTTNSRPEVSDTEAFFICFKAVRAAVRINGGIEGPVEIKMSSLIPSCKRGDKEFTFNEIVSAIEKTSKTFKIGLEVSPNISERKLTLTGANRALKNLCEIGANAFGGSYTCFNIKDAFGHTFDKVFAAPKKETAVPTKNVLVFTDEERDRIFHIGGHLNEVGCQNIEDLQSYLSHLGKDPGASKLEALVRQVPEFKVEGNMVFLASEWDKFRKTYRLLDSSNKEQVIIKIACSEEWMRRYLGSCQVKKIDSFGNINIFRVDVPVESEVAKVNLISLIEKFRENEGFYSETRFSKWLEKQWKKTRFEERIKSDTYRFEIGYFEKKRG